jgi:trigger factor
LEYNLVEEENWHRKLEVTIPEEEVSEKFGEVYKALKHEAKIPGFRPGKAPMDIIKSRYGKLAEKEVLETLVPDAYTKAVKEAEIIPISEPQFSMIVIENGKPVTFTAEFDVRPIVEIKKAGGFALKKQKVDVPETDIEKAFNHIIDQQSSLKPKEGTAIEGDLVIVDMEKLSDPDNTIKEEKLTDFTFELNRDVTLPAFCDNLIGTNPGDVRDIEVTYPDDYYDKNMASKSLEFKVTVKEIREIIRPEMNEAFFKQFGEVKNEEELKNLLRDDLTKRKEQEVDSDIKDQAIKSVIAANEFDMPASLLDNYLDTVIADMKEQSKDEKVDEDAVREKYRVMGIRFIRWNLLFHKIAENEKITAAKEDTDQWLQNFADKSKVTFEQAKEFLASQRKIQDIKETILEEKVLDFVIESSTIEDM